MRRLIPALCALLCMAFLLAPAASAAEPVRPIGAEPDTYVDATGLLILDRTSGAPLYEHNADTRIYPASTTKIMTALCLVNAVDDLDGTTLTVHDSVLALLPDDDISLAGLVDGEELTVRQLLYSLLVPSGNDAAVVIADYLGGGIAGFADIMNETAQALGCTDTHFATPHGLSGTEHYSTCRDMARIAEALLENPVLAEIVHTPRYLLTTNRHTDLELESTNLLIDPESDYYIPAVQGIKTGSSTLSGRCLISAAEQDGLSLLCVMMGAPYQNSNGMIIDPSPAITQMYSVYEWLFSTFSRVPLWDGETPFTLTVEKFGEATASPAETLTAVLTAEQAQAVTPIAAFVPGLQAPLSAGTSVGTVTYMCGDVVLASVPLVLDMDIHTPIPWQWLIPAGVLLLVLLVCLFFIHRKRMEARRLEQF